MSHISLGEDRYGPFLMIDGFRSVMPNKEIAVKLAAAPDLLECLKALIIATTMPMTMLKEEIERAEKLILKIEAGK